MITVAIEERGCHPMQSTGSPVALENQCRHCEPRVNEPVSLLRKLYFNNTNSLKLFPTVLASRILNSEYMAGASHDDFRPFPCISYLTFYIHNSYFIEIENDITISKRTTIYKMCRY